MRPCSASLAEGCMEAVRTRFCCCRRRKWVSFRHRSCASSAPGHFEVPSSVVTMSERTKLKKSESLEIRLPYPTKQAFMARCRDDGRSASDAMRGFIDYHLARDARRATV